MQKTIEDLKLARKKFTFNRTILLLSGLYFSYDYILNFSHSPLVFKIIMGLIISALFIGSFYIHKKLIPMDAEINAMLKDLDNDTNENK